MTVLIRSLTLASPHGYIRREHADGLVEEHDALQCCHCQRTWRYLAGSGRQRGWCASCQNVVCGRPECMAECSPWQRRIGL